MKHAINEFKNVGIRSLEHYELSSPVPSQHRELPSLEPTLIFNLGNPIQIVDATGGELTVGTGQVFYAGLHQRWCFSRASDSQAGVHVRLSIGAAWRLLGPGAGACADRAGLIGDVGDGRLAKAAINLGPPRGDKPADEVAAILRAALVDAPEPPRTALATLRDLTRPGVRIGDVAADVGWSRRHFAARSSALTGVTPKVLARLARYRRLLDGLTAADQRSWAERALDAGYCDQSHMVREFTAFTGLAPSAYHPPMR